MTKQSEVSREKFFFTDNLKLAAALTAAGYHLTNVDSVIIGPSERHTFELEPKHNGIKAAYFLGAFENKIDLPERVAQIIAERGITPEEQTILAFDAGRAAMHNGSTIFYCAKNKKPLVAKEIGGGRTLIYREGTPRDHLKKLIENA